MQIVQWDPLNAKQSSPQNILVRAMGKCIFFHYNHLYDFREWGVGLQIQSYLGFYLSQSNKIGVKLKLRHMFCILWSDKYIVLFAYLWILMKTLKIK